MVTEVEKEPTADTTTAKGMEIRNTNSGLVTFINTAYVTPKLINLMCAFMDALNEPGHGLYTIVFRMDGYPRIKEGDLTSWMFYPDSKSAVCNLSDCIDIALNEGLDDENGIEAARFFNIRTSIWKIIFQNFFHEVHHARAFLTGRDVFEDKDLGEDAKKEEEESAYQYARDMILEAAKKWDIEPDFSEIMLNKMSSKISNEAALIIKNKEATDEENEWVETQDYMESHNITFYVPTNKDEDPIIYETFKEFLHSITEDAEDDPAWNSPTIGTSLELTQKPDVTTAKVHEKEIPANTKTVGELPFTPDNQSDEFISDGFIEEDTMVNDYVEPEATFLNPQHPATINQNHPVTPKTTVTVNPTMGEGMYEKLNLPTDHIQAIIKGLYGKIFNQIFQGCGYNPTTKPFFTSPEKIAEVVPLNTDETKIVRHMSCYNQDGQLQEGVEIKSWISGKFIDSAKTLPGFELSLNRGDGTRILRKFIPQNPWKIREGTNPQVYTNTAIEAQQGNQILWIIDPDAIDKTMAARIYNGVLQNNASGSWQPV